MGKKYTPILYWYRLHTLSKWSFLKEISSPLTLTKSWFTAYIHSVEKAARITATTVQHQYEKEAGKVSPAISANTSVAGLGALWMGHSSASYRPGFRHAPGFVCNTHTALAWAGNYSSWSQTPTVPEKTPVPCISSACFSPEPRNDRSGSQQAPASVPSSQAQPQHCSSTSPTASAQKARSVAFCHPA